MSMTQGFRKPPFSCCSYSILVSISLLAVQGYLRSDAKRAGPWPCTGIYKQACSLGLTTALVVGVVAPLVIPHATHPSMIYHILLHMAGLTIAIFLSIVSSLAYSRNTTASMLLMAVGFMSLALVELFYLLQVGGIVVGQFIIPEINIELSHMILLIMVSLFGLGVLKVNK